MIVGIEPESSVPIYMQLVDRIKQMVFSGELGPGQQLPTMRQLAADLRINYNTVGRAYAVLDAEGIISTQQGRGTFIAHRMSDEQVQRLRMDKLHSMMGQILREAYALGYSRPEIEEGFADQLAQAAEEAGRAP